MKYKLDHYFNTRKQINKVVEMAINCRLHVDQLVIINKYKYSYS